MGFWKKLAIGAKVGLGIAIKLNDAGLIKVKELEKVKTVKEIVEGEVATIKPSGRPPS